MLNKGSVTKQTENGQDYWSADGVNNPWEAPGIEILPAMKKAIGNEDYVTVTVSFEMRATFKNAADADDFNVGVLIRAYTEDGYTVDDFKADYEGGFIKNSSDTNLIGRFTNEEPISGSEWTKVSYDIEDLAAEDVNFDHFTSWMLCVDRISSEMTGKIKTLDFKNVSVTVDGGNDEQPDDNTGSNTGDTKPSAVANSPIPTARPGKATPTPVAVNTPVNFDKYPQTLVDGTVPEAGNVTPAPGETAQPTDNGGATTDNTKTNNTVLYIVIGIVAVVVIGAAVAFIVIKKKKSTDGEAK